MAERPVRRRGAALDPGGRTRMAEMPREWKPLLDVLETDSHYVVKVNLPGLEREHVHLMLPDEWTLVIRGTYGSEECGPGCYLIAERPQAPVEKAVRFPKRVVADQVEAVLELGVLTVSLPKKFETPSRPRQIAIS